MSFTSRKPLEFSEKTIVIRGELINILVFDFDRAIHRLELPAVNHEAIFFERAFVLGELLFAIEET